MMDRKSPVLLFVASPLKESAFLPSQVLWHLTALIKHVPEPDKTSFWWVIQAPGVLWQILTPDSSLMLKSLSVWNQ